MTRIRTRIRVRTRIRTRIRARTRARTRTRIRTRTRTHQCLKECLKEENFAQKSILVKSAHATAQYITEHAANGKQNQPKGRLGAATRFSVTQFAALPKHVTV